MQILLDERTFETLRRRAFERKQSLSATVRELLSQALGGPPRRRWRVEDFTFIGSGSSKDPYVVSEEHDRALGELDEW